MRWQNLADQVHLFAYTMGRLSYQRFESTSPYIIHFGRIDHLQPDFDASCMKAYKS